VSATSAQVAGPVSSSTTSPAAQRVAQAHAAADQYLAASEARLLTGRVLTIDGEASGPRQNRLCLLDLVLRAPGQVAIVQAHPAVARPAVHAEPILRSERDA
jgi:hypothetical protein